MESPIQAHHHTHTPLNQQAQQTYLKNQNNATTRPRKVIGKFYLSKTLGKGSMGKVKLALNTETNEKVAVKIVPRRFALHASSPLTKKERDTEITREIRTIREASIMLLLDHPFIARADEMVLMDNFYYLFMEYVDGGQLLDYIISHGKLKERQARQFSRQIASALDYCHRNSVVHRDLKVENILISRSGTIKIIDFGLSNVFSPRSHLSTFCGSLYFAAPELLDGRMYTGPEVDVWSFGVVIYVLVVGSVPFDDKNVAALHAKVKQGNVEYPGHVSSDCKSLLQCMLVTHRKQRASMSQVIVHPWLNKGYDAPVENYLPKRKPLQVPVDMHVVCGMQGFEFGTKEEIKNELESLITSEEYQASAKQLESMPEEVPSRHMLRRRSFFHTMNYPPSTPAAYHPLISVYYLVQERMQRDALCKKQQGQIKELPDTSSSFQQDSIGISYTAHGKTPVKHQTSQQEQDVVQSALDVAATSPRVSSSDFGHGHSCRKASDTSATSTLSTFKSTAKPSIFRRLSRRLSRQLPPDDQLNPSIANTRRCRRDSGDASLMITKKTDMDDAPMVTLSGSPVLPEHHPSSQMGDERLGKKINRLFKRAASITVKDLPSTHHGTEHETTRERRPSAYTTPIEHSPFSSSGQDNNVRARRGLEEDTAASAVLALHTVEQDESYADRRKQKADDAVKSVYLRGLFSVATTSNKKAPVIRQEIIRLLEEMDISYLEKKGRFECILSSSRPGNNQLSDTSDDDDDTKKDPLAVRFDITIVKIPLLWGMHGVRFRRVSGDPWRYKDTCSMILNSLNL